MFDQYPIKPISEASYERNFKNRTLGFSAIVILVPNQLVPLSFTFATQRAILLCGGTRGNDIACHGLKVKEILSQAF